MGVETLLNMPAARMPTEKNAAYLVVYIVIKATGTAQGDSPQRVRQRLGLDDMLGKASEDAKPVLPKYANLMAIPCRTLHWKILLDFMSGGSVYTPAPKATCALDYLPQWSF